MTRIAFLGCIIWVMAKGIVCRVGSSYSKLLLNLKNQKKEYTLSRLHGDGLFEIVLPDIKKVFKYTVFATYKDGKNSWVDPYSFSQHNCRRPYFI